MQAVENAWKQFFGQFAPYVFSEGELIQDPANNLYPRITFNYQVGDFFTPVLTAFQVWTWGHNNAELLTVCDRIAEAVPVEAGASLAIPGELYYEYRHPVTGQWIRFSIDQFQSLADQFAPTPITWRENKIDSAGGIEIWRGNPFLTPSPKDEAMSRVMFGTLQCRYLNTM